MKVDGLVEQAINQPTTKLPSLEGKSDAQLRKAAKDFETMFMNLVMKEMRETVPDSEAWGDSSKVKFFQGMLDEEYSRMSSENPQNSLAEMIYKNLKARLHPQPATPETLPLEKGGGL